MASIAPVVSKALLGDRSGVVVGGVKGKSVQDISRFVMASRMGMELGRSVDVEADGCGDKFLERADDDGQCACGDKMLSFGW